MVNFPGRNGRRRRVLNDDVLSASSTRVALHVPPDKSHELPPRYSDAAGVENHPQITDFVPRRFRTIAMLAVTGLATTIALAGMHYIAPSLATAIGAERLIQFDLASSGGVAAWMSAVVLFMCSIVCLLIYSIRRYRIDDIRGRYRIWLAAAAASMLVSANSVTGLHDVLAQSLSHATGWSALRAGAVWWLAVVGLPLGWIALRSLLDAKECGLAATFMVTAIICYAAATASYLGLISAADPTIQMMLYGGLTFSGHWLTFAAAVSYARFVVLDAQGLVEHRRSARDSVAKKSKRSSAKAEPSATPAATSTAGEKRQSPSQVKPAESPATLKSWVDGRRPERKRYDDEADDEGNDSSKLSKADRKQLRKLKAQNRAA